MDIFVHAAILIARENPGDFEPRWPEVAKMTGSQDLEEAVKNRKGPETVLESYRESAVEFQVGNGEVQLYEK